jgi:hypothetical protein
MVKSPHSLRPLARPRRNRAISAITGKPITLVLDVTKEKESQKESQENISLCDCGKKDMWCIECYGEYGYFICFD